MSIFFRFPSRTRARAAAAKKAKRKKQEKKSKKDSPTTFSSLAILGVQSRMVASDFSEIVCVGIEHAESPEWTPA